MWAKATGAGGYDRGTGLALSGGNRLHVVGTFEGTVDFNPGVGNYPLTSAGESDMYHQILDTAGNFIAASRTGGSGGDYANAVVVDSAGAVYTTGNFTGGVDFDPSPANGLLSSPGMTTAGFVRKLSAGGDFEWAHKVAFLSNDLALGPCATVHCTGALSQTFQFDPPVGGNDAFVIKINQEDPTGMDAVRADYEKVLILSANPTYSTVTLRSAHGLLKGAHIRLLDATGRTLGEWLSTQEHAFDLDMQQLAAGWYWVRGHECSRSSSYSALGEAVMGDIRRA